MRGSAAELPDGPGADVRYNIFPAAVAGEGNIAFTVPAEYFADYKNGDLRLTVLAERVFEKGVALTDVQFDIFGSPRTPVPDLGAHQLK